MRHKYRTAALVIGRVPHGEANLTATLLTRDFGVIFARAQGARKPGAKMAAGLQTLTHTEVTLLRGKDGWRLAGTILLDDYPHLLPGTARTRAARVFSLIDRLVRGESPDPRLYELAHAYSEALVLASDDAAETAEALAALRALGLLGLDAGESLGATTDFSPEAIERAAADRTELIARINRGIAASGL
jgi:DNA repair protein RecO